MDIKFCFNLQEYDFDQLKFILVGDNPGKEEFEENRYFVGSAGKQLREHFEENSICRNFESQCMLFNKTFISTTEVSELKEIKERLGEENFNKIQIDSANRVSNLSNSLDLPVLIFGKGNVKSGGIFHPFWKELKKRMKKEENILLFSHTSHGHFSREWEEYKKGSDLNSNLALLKEIGTENRREADNSQEE